MANFANENVYKRFSDCRIFDMDEDRYTTNDLNNITNHVGQHIKKMTLNYLAFKDKEIPYLERTLQHFPHLDELRLKNFTIETFSNAFQRYKMHSLKHLILERCSEREPGLQDLTNIFPNLTDFTVSYYLDFTCRNGQRETTPLLNSLHSLKHFEIFSFSKLNPSGSLIKDCLVKNKNSLEKLTLFERSGIVNERRIQYQIKFPKLKHLQMFIEHTRELEYIETTNLKFLQLYGPYLMSQRYNGSIWSLSGYPFLEELDLVSIAGINISIAAQVPTIHDLGIQLTDISPCDVLSHTISKLPNLQCLRLRRCIFCPDELALLIENSQLNEIEIEVSVMWRDSLEIYQVLEILLRKNTDGRKYFPFELRIIIDQIDVSIKLILTYDR